MEYPMLHKDLPTKLFETQLKIDGYTFSKECLETNNRILFKLNQRSPLNRWINLFDSVDIDLLTQEIQNRDIVNLLNATKQKNTIRVGSIAKKCIQKNWISE